MKNFDTLYNSMIKESEIQLIDIYKQILNESTVKKTQPKKFSNHATTRLTSKMWITPEGKGINLNGFHQDWILKNKDNIIKKYPIKLPKTYDETAIRLAAINVGFFRINYEINNGHMIVEGNTKFFNKIIKDEIFMIIAKNRKSIDNISIIIMNDTGKIIKQGSTRLFVFDDNEKLEHIPFITESIRRNWIGIHE